MGHWQGAGEGVRVLFCELRGIVYRPRLVRTVFRAIHFKDNLLHVSNQAHLDLSQIFVDLTIKRSTSLSFEVACVA